MKRPAWLGELAVALAVTAATFVLRLAIERLTPGVVPFALVFPAVAGATLLTSWRAGLAVLAICQLTAWYFFLPEPRSFRIATLADVISLIVTTTAQLVMLWAMHRYASAYRQAAIADRARAAAEAARADDLRLAMRELDHRTMNNFQLAAAVLRSQQGCSGSPELRQALDAASQKLMILAAMHRELRDYDGQIGSRPLAPLLEEVAAALRAQAPGPDISVVAELEPVEVPHDCALRLALITNELGTNAIKHAFPQGRGVISISLKRDGSQLMLTVADNGIGGKPGQASGSGSRLVEMLANAIHAQLTIGYVAGTRATLAVPLA